MKINKLNIMLFLIILSIFSCSKIPDNFTSEWESASIISPAGTILIDNNKYYTSASSVTITNIVSDADQMQFSNDGTTWSVWETYSPSKSWSLESGHGQKTVYGQFRKTGGGITLLTDTIVPLNKEKIISSDGVEYDNFGGGNWGFTTNVLALSNDGNTLFVGCFIKNKVYIYKKNSSGTWIETKILSPDAARYLHFGQSLACSDDASTLVIGALGGPIGAIFIYTWDGTTYNPVKTIEYVSNHDFGVNVSISDNGNKILVGAWHSDSAFLYEKAGSDWNMTKQFVPSDGLTGGIYGVGVKIAGDGNTIVIGAPTQNGNIGSVYIYKWNGIAWSFLLKKTSPYATPDLFGRHIDITTNGERIIVGLRSWTNGSAVQGAAFLYDWDGITYNLSHTFQASDNITGADDKFGYCVSMSSDGNIIAISAPGTSYIGNGKSYIYRFNGSGWNEEYIINEYIGVNEYIYGNLIFISGDGSTIAVGTPRDIVNTNIAQGSVYLYY